ncbi:hypothetical protein CAFE_27040 [Caprobacter fermentans]|uniref:VOC family protein n=1 Tax=Caproicibacter fermentans TaxID=2576756 RepID=A0A6N8I258_9FIRM|nr:hypothetical protein [Caproicibacter fermentans]MVB11975.1 hypothetical protein [Caproicibacter fermentans]OCM99800.1 hypothetical protein A7X67_09900 [Clostridium sp. W14A]QNK41218.1 VOC family protein [Caproicibacter fermentans]
MDRTDGKDFGFEVAHIGINQDNEEEAKKTAQLLCNLFGFESRNTPGSIFANEQFEIMKTKFLGRYGHIAIRTTDINRAKEYLESKGIAFNEESASRNEKGNLGAIYFQNEIAGFAFHLLQKK